MPKPLEGKFVALGVTGSIACYKAVDLASKLTQLGASVDVLFTRSVSNFLTPLTFQSITHRPVISDIFDPSSEIGIDHVAVAERADIVVVAPATANTIARMAHGMADDALTTTVLATRAPVVICPAMDGHMYDNPATQQNLETLRARGHHIVGPAQGRLASGLVGSGRLVEPQDILGHIRLILGKKGDMASRKIVVSAGGTQEAVDPVRFIGNRSSGKMGYAIAEAARDRGANTVLVSAPTDLLNPVGVRVYRVVSAQEMRDAVIEECREADALIMAAAVADWRPITVASQKLKKGTAETWAVKLTRNPDILAEARGDRLIKVGFAAESEDLLNNARAKIVSKGLHFIAANDITAADSGFAADTNRVILLDREGCVEDLGLLPKYEVGQRILDKLATIMR